MTRATFAGLDLSGDPWRFCVAAVDESEAFAPLSCEALAVDAVGEFWSQAEQLLDAASLKPFSATTLDRHLAHYLPQAQELAKATGQIAALGMALPCGHAPAIRQRLAAQRFGLSGVLPQVWEAPLAGLIECLSTESPAESGRRLLLTPGPLGGELTAVAWEADGSTLLITISAVHECSRDAAELLTQWEAWSPAARARLTGHAATLQVFGESLAAAGKELANRLGAPASFVAADCIAAGAARGAALMNRRTLYGTAWNEVKVNSCVVRPIGVVGMNAAGQKFWRLLFDAGTPYAPEPTCPLAVRAAASPEYVLLQLADAVFAAGHSPLWLSETDAAWPAAGLRLYAQRHLPQAAKQKSGRLEITLKNARRASQLNDDLVGLTWTGSEAS